MSANTGKPTSPLLLEDQILNDVLHSSSAYIEQLVCHPNGPRGTRQRTDNTHMHAMQLDFRMCCIAKSAPDWFMQSDTPREYEAACHPRGDPSIVDLSHESKPSLTLVIQ
jgi:hypothetical protein